jgi:hypothetical protein
MSGFDRQKQVVGNRAIMVTSWYDDVKQTWRASAPGYAHLAVVTGTADKRCENRKQAVDEVVTVLVRYLSA